MDANNGVMGFLMPSAKCQQRGAVTSIAHSGTLGKDGEMATLPLPFYWHIKTLLFLCIFFSSSTGQFSKVLSSNSYGKGIIYGKSKILGIGNVQKLFVKM